MARKKMNKNTLVRGSALARKIKIERIKKSLTQNELSLRAKVPLDTLRSIENGRIQSPGIFLVADIIYALDGKLDTWLKQVSPSHSKKKDFDETQNES